jgi:polyhydroxybutyrate depolymerase
LVLLHGGGGTKTSLAYHLGMNSNPSAVSVNSVNWAWLEANHLMLVLPQGQHLSSEPEAATWSNHAMNSGQDDQAFLVALAARIRADYGVSQVVLMGHSMGGTMANRMWCESPSSFDAYVSLAGPASAYYQDAATPCAPGSAARPYLGVVGAADEVMQTTDAWAGPLWSVNPTLVLASLNAWDNSQMVAEWPQQQRRVSAMCGETLSLEGFTTTGQVDTWRACNQKLVLQRVNGAQHAVDSLETQLGATTTPNVNLMDAVVAFLAAAAPL